MSFVNLSAVQGCLGQQPLSAVMDVMCLLQAIWQQIAGAMPVRQGLAGRQNILAFINQLCL